MTNKLTDEEIKALIESAKQEGPITEHNEAEQFVAALGIKPGNAKIHVMLIWHHYKLWAKKPLTRMQFCQLFNKIFARHRNNSTKRVYYWLDPTPFDLSEETYWKCTADLREEKRAKAQKK